MKKTLIECCFMILCIFLPRMSHTQDFSIVVFPTEPEIIHAYCDIVTFSFKITNLGTSATYEVKVSPSVQYWDYVDFGNLPDNEPQLDGEFNVIAFTTPVIPFADDIIYHFQMKGKTPHLYDYGFYVNAKEVGTTLLRDAYYNLNVQRNKNTGLNDFIYASDVIEDWPNNPSLYPLGSPFPACSSNTVSSPV